MYTLYRFTSGNLYILDSSNTIIKRVIMDERFCPFNINDVISVSVTNDVTKVFSSANLDDVTGYACLEAL